ncbi:hypothetical protein GCM10023116_20190 [Kistimonas scapharcae]|uniref:Fungal lipase-like domain-containing protein n=1 Tax=Kistimonas scapharcae TaxID=1036133 RepID=A0ABP8V2V5_9GAMM
MSGKVGDNGPILPRGGIESVVIPNESKATRNGVSVSKMDGMPIVQQACQADAESSVPVSQKTLSVRKVAQKKVQAAQLRLLNNTKAVVSRVLGRANGSSGTDRFERQLKREVFIEGRMQGLNRLESTSETHLDKNVKKAISLGKRLIRQRGDIVLNSIEAGEKKRVQHSPVSEVKGLTDFLKLNRAEQENIANHVLLCDAAYQGFDPDFEEICLPPGCTLLKQEELPVELQMLYDEATGLIHAPDNAKAMLVRKGEAIVVIFAGTEPGSKRVTGRSSTIKTDITQWLGMDSPMYRSAAAVFDLLLGHPPLKDSVMLTAGHSLAGGLASFAYTAVQGRYAPERLGGVITVNSAGLSWRTLNKLGEARVNLAKDSIQNIRIKGDPVSPSGRKKAGLAIKGQLIGSIMTLPDPEKRGVGVHRTTVAIDVIDAHMSAQIKKDS